MYLLQIHHSHFIKLFTAKLQWHTLLQLKAIFAFYHHCYHR